MTQMGWLSSEELRALGWTLLAFVWQGGAIAALFAVVDRLTRRASATVRYAVALCALALMPLSVMATFATQIESPAKTAGMVRGSGNPLHEIVMPQAAHDPNATVGPLGVSTLDWAARLSPVLPWVDGVWAAGVLLLALRTAGGWLRLERMRRRARGVAPAYVLESFHAVRKALNAGSRVVLRISDEVMTPLAMGVWRATVILPASVMMQLSPDELQAVLAHEIGHICRWDYACNLVQTAIESVLFFHPAVWWVSRAVRDRREECCDAIAVETCRDPLLYAQALLRLEEQRVEKLELAMALRGHRGSGLVGRVERILGESSLREDKSMAKRMTGGVRVAVAAAMVLCVLLGPKVRNAAAAVRIQAKQDVPAQGADLKAPTIKIDQPRLDGPKVDEPSAVITSDGVKPDGRVIPNTQVQTNVNADVRVAGVRVDTMQEGASTEPQAPEKPATGKGTGYIDGMREAGYALDLDKDLNTLVSMKALGITPEYAKEMGNVGMGKPSAHDLISMKAQGITPEWLSSMKQSGLGPKDFHQAISEKALGVTPEYSTEMNKLGLGDMDVEALISLKAQGMSPQYGAWLKKQFPQITVDQLRRAAVFHIDEHFVSEAKAHGFSGNDLDKLLRLKMSGLLDE